ncbi:MULTISPECIES: molecular chaperone HtpG [Acinetobacter]|uniref:Chaperone protein HtpG n=1 Tax=Acinetobacter baylyi (strain ATCC 33305 / BD413 / ADP1) TaxID=62977 RepID=HTPG_ACIAD|nr:MULTISPECIES: molecular chaperone HtpG [Acinetobacter]Q6FF82.1 RecName: Full=Chaperone protein HtpG; AltName: Full=Heat shock protein HtpG; AltName: Full=High temperature protein G [Acinetobacter baylyi ADP1]ENV52856.1 chaperone htpG [Acinetobacter baylyi DSM 14961 = CIP 107474]KAF2369271.1 molecular chaperone HtpG [Acinetobacter baylyi]KAF2373674.1 molecular chaperone HtpG [Acinetobacter baylyi]KAF2374961.1 molecular chaperone HtpG [Acinetobacter baylyi]KAF2379485.1 molecular chaperone Ht
MTEQTATQNYSFQAEVAQLLHLVTHSLYSNPEIFLRELISNASDACDKLRFEGINHPEYYEDDANLRVRVSLDKENKTITISDNGIGLSQQEAIDNLGTIAKSGTKDFMSKLTGDQKSDAQLIGQFGVGFYSGFIVADKITVESRRAGLPANDGVRWISGGTGDFEVQQITKDSRGTSIILHLRDDALDYLDAWKVKQIINKYSDHISLPIEMQKEVWQEEEVAEGEEPKGGQYVKTDEWEVINSASALWTRSKNEISEEQYIEFYKNLTHDFDAPLAWSHNRVEGNTEYTQLLYIPAKASSDIFTREAKAGIKLYVKRVFIMDDADNLIPNYLRFVKGVIDSADLPLNVSRELLQESRDVKTIREGNTRRVLTLLDGLAKSEDEKDQEKFKTFYQEFGSVLKEGLGEDFTNRERILKLLRYATSNQDEISTSFADYKARMKEGQKAIYYVSADSLAAAKNSPQLELFKKKGIEVLLMSERVDEWAMNFVHEFDGTPLQNVSKGAVDLGDLQDAEEKKALEQAAEQFKPVVDKLTDALKDKTKEVRVTTRLVDSPACLVTSDGELSPQLIRMLKQAGQAVPESKPILEINPEHPLVQKLEGSAQFDDLANVIFDQAVIAEGGLPEDPAAYVKRINSLLLK